MAAGMGGDSLGHWFLYRDEGVVPAMRKNSQEKPPYGVLTMKEIRALSYSGLTAISTFSGCGGSSLGYRMAGYRVLWASEFVKAAQEVYRLNHDAYLDTRDIRHVTAKDILAQTGLAVGELDLLDGSPPCASFSMAGRRQKHWGKTKIYSDKKQRTDDLFFEYARILQGLQPKVFVAENVSGLVRGAAKGYFKEIMQALQKCGYRVRCKLLDAQWLGVPQSRIRTIFIGVRNDLEKDPDFPKPLAYRYTVRDAIPWIDSESGIYSVAEETRIDKYAIGKEWERLAEGEQSEKYFSLVKVDRNKPCPTVCAQHGGSSIASITHPIERRKFTIAELKRLCAFPDDFALTGTYAQQWERLGRAVPPVMMCAIATTIKEKILCPIQM